MSVHVDELHSDVVTTADPASDQRADRPSELPWEVEARWLEAQRRVEWLARRVCAVDFDD